VAVEAINNGADFYLQKGGDFRGQFAELVSMMKQAVQRHRSDQALRESEERYRQLVDNIGIGVAMYEATEDGRDFILRDFNRGAQNIDKVKKEEVIGRKVTDVFPGIDEMGLLDVLRRVHQTGNPEFYPLSYYHDNRIVGYRENHVYRLPSDEVVAVYEDATARKETEARIEHLASFPLLNPDPVLELKIGAGITYANASAYKMIREMGMEDDPSLLLPKDIEDIIKALKDSGATRTVREVEVGGRVVQATILNVLGTDLIRVYETDITERKRTEEALRSNEQKLSLVMDNMTDTVWLINMQMRPIWMSPSVFRASGFTLEELASMPLDQQIAPQSLQKVMLAMSTLLTPENLNDPAKEIAFADELEYYRKDGSTQWNDMVYTVLRDELGRPTSILVVGRDVTDRKLAEEAMRNTQAQLRIAMDLAKLVHWEYDVDKDLFTFDDQFYALYGSSKEKEGGQLMSSATYAKRFIPPEEAGVVAEETAKAISTTDPNYFGNVTHTIIRADGERRIINVRFGVVKDAAGRTVRTFGANQDITELKRVEDALRESEANYLALMNNTEDSIWSIDRDCRLVLGNSVFNERAKRNLGKSIEKGENVLEQGGEPEVVRQWEIYYDRALQGEHFRIESISRTVPEPGLVEYVFSPIQNEKGEISGVIISGRDIADRKKMEEELRQTNIKLNLLSSITRHDLLNQLSAVSGYVVLAKEKVRSPEAKSLLAKADQASSNMAHLLSFTKEYERLGKAEPVWISLSQVSSQGVRDVEHQGMELKVDLGSYEVYADRLLERAFHNLAINSVKHSVKGKKMEISCEVRPEGLVVVFQDDGVGISAMRKEEIFESERGHRGLFLVRSILDITGIKIKENGVEGQGARFEILVPKGRYRSSSG